MSASKNPWRGDIAGGEGFKINEIVEAIKHYNTNPSNKPISLATQYAL